MMTTLRTFVVTSTVVVWICSIRAQEIPSSDKNANCFAVCLAKCMWKQKEADLPLNRESCYDECKKYRDVAALCTSSSGPREICEMTCNGLYAPGSVPGVSIATDDISVKYDEETGDPNYAVLDVKNLDPRVMVLIVEMTTSLPTGNNPVQHIVIPITDLPDHIKKPKMCDRYTFRVAPVTAGGIGAFNADLVTLIQPKPLWKEGSVMQLLNMTYKQPMNGPSSIEVFFAVPLPLGYDPNDVSFKPEILFTQCPSRQSGVITVPRAHKASDSVVEINNVRMQLYTFSLPGDLLDASDVETPSCELFAMPGVMNGPCSNHQPPLDDIPPLSIRIDCKEVINASAVCSGESKDEILMPFCSAVDSTDGINYTIVAGEPNWSKSEVLDDYKELVEKSHNLTINITIDKFNPGPSPHVDTSKPLYFIMAYGPPSSNASRHTVPVTDSIFAKIDGYSRSCLPNDNKPNAPFGPKSPHELYGGDWKIEANATAARQLPRLEDYASKCTNDTSHNPLQISNARYGKYLVIICAVYDPRWEMIPMPLNDSEWFKRSSGKTLTIDIKPSVEAPEPDHTTTIVVGVFVPVIIIALLATICIVLFRRQSRRRVHKMQIELQNKDRRYNEYIESVNNGDSYEILRQRLIIDRDRKLGSGAFGHVYLGKLLGRAEGALKENDQKSSLAATHMRFENCDVAIKMLPDSADPYSKEAFLQEISIMKQLGWHDNLVNILACVTTAEPYCLVVEYCSDGNLLEYLRNRTKYMLKLEEDGVKYWEPDEDTAFDASMILTLKQVLSFALQVSYGMEYLAKHNFVHRDLAARNVLVDNKVAKVADFGLCRKVDEHSAAYTTKGGRLPFKWMSLESLQCNEFTSMSDVWSYGVLLFELISFGGEPYPNINPHSIQKYLEDGNRMSPPEHCDENLYNIMSMCWHVNPLKRPKFSEIREMIAKELETVVSETYNYLDPAQDYYQPLHRERQYEEAKKEAAASDNEQTEMQRHTSDELFKVPLFTTASTLSPTVNTTLIEPDNDYERPKSVLSNEHNASIASPSGHTFFLPTVKPHSDRPTTPGSFQTTTYPLDKRQQNDEDVAESPHDYYNEHSSDNIALSDNAYTNQFSQV